MPTYYRATTDTLTGAAGAIVSIVLNRPGHKFVEVKNWTNVRLRVTTNGDSPTVAANNEVDLIEPFAALVIESFNEPDTIQISSAGAFEVSARGLQQQ